MDGKRAHATYIVALVLFGTNGIVASTVTRLDSMQIVMFRTMLGGLLLMSVFLLLGGRPAIGRDRRDSVLLAMSGISMGISWMFQYEAYREIGIGTTSLIYCCGPAILMVLSPFIFRERVTWNRVAGFAIVSAGAVLMSVDGLGSGGSAWGYVCGFMTAVAYVAMIVFNKSVKGIRGLENPSFQLVFAFATVLVCVLLSGDLPTGFAVVDAVPMAVLGLVNTGFGCLLYFVSIGYIPGQTVAICDYIEPMSALILATVLLSEPIDGTGLAGVAAILIGLSVGEVLGRVHRTDGGNDTYP